MKTKLKAITTKEAVAELLPLVETIWREVFPPIIEEAQIEYMLQNYQSQDNIWGEINNGVQYYFITEENTRYVGYLAFELREECLFISKIYLIQTARGKGLSSEIFDWLEETALNHGKDRLQLRVNRSNTRAIEVYLHKGFVITHSGISDIGGGFVMDDYYFEKVLSTARPLCKEMRRVCYPPHLP